MSIALQPPAGHPLEAAVAAMSGALDEALDASAWSLSDDALADLLEQAEVAARRLHAVSLRLVREADGRNLAGRAGATSTASWLRGRLRLHPGDAKRRVQMAAALADGGPCAATGSALASGALGADAARVITETLTALPASGASERAAADRADAEAVLLDGAATFDPAELAKMGRHLLHVLDPIRGESLEEREARQVERRELHLGTGAAAAGGGMNLLRGHLDDVSAALLAELLEPLAKPRPEGPEGKDSRSAARRRGDAFADLLRAIADAGTVPEAGGERPHVTVTMTLETLEQRLGAAAAELDFGLPVSAQTARLLACDARIVPVVLGAAGQPLDVGRISYSCPMPLRRALVARDRGCSFPGCGAPPTRCDAHHVRHWADGGPTALCNLCLLCARHHRMIHAGEWAVTIAADGHPEFHPPPWVDPQRKPSRPDRVTLDNLRRTNECDT